MVRHYLILEPQFTSHAKGSMYIILVKIPQYEFTSCTEQEIYCIVNEKEFAVQYAYVCGNQRKKANGGKYANAYTTAGGRIEF